MHAFSLKKLKKVFLLDSFMKYNQMLALILNFILVVHQKIISDFHI